MWNNKCCVIFYSSDKFCVFPKYIIITLNTNMNTKALGYQPNAFYDATAVCSLLQIPMMALKQHKNKETVSYALNNNMSKLEVLFVAYELAKDMEAKERLQQEDKALKF